MLKHVFEPKAEMTDLSMSRFNTRTRKVVADGISKGILSSKGLSVPGCSVWLAMKEMKLSFGILMTDFLEAALREMASSVPVILLCQSSSPHTSQLPAAKQTSCDCHSRQNAADGGLMGSAG